MIVLVADRIAIADVAAMVGISRRFVYKWVQRFLQQGLEGLAEQPSRGAPRVSRQLALAE
jgi:transposase